MKSYTDAIISGGVVAFGVVLAEWLKRSHERTMSLRTNTMSLTIKVPRVVVGMTDTGTPTDTGVNSLWSQDRESAMELLNLISLTQVGFRRHGKVIKSEARDLNAKLAAAEFEFFSQGLLLTRSEAFDISTEKLFAAVFGKVKNSDELVRSYMHNPPEPLRPQITPPHSTHWNRILTRCRKWIRL